MPQSTDIVINTGCWLRKPLESDLAVLTRLFHCNSSLTFTGWCKILNNKKVCSTGKMFELLVARYIQLVAAQSLTKQNVNKHVNQIQKSSPQLCNECRRAGYHTYLYHFKWLHTCPLHSKPLKSECSECNQELWLSKAFFKHDCKLCGLKPLKEYLNLQHTLDQQDFSYLTSLSDHVDKVSRAPELKFWWMPEKGCLVLNNYKLNMSPSDRDFASVMMHLYPEALDTLKPFLSYQTVIHKHWRVKPIRWYRSDHYTEYKNPPHSFENNELSRLELTGHIYQLPRKIIKARRKAIKRVYQLLNKMHPDSHPLHKPDISTNISVDNDCPLCVAFGCWYSTLLIDNSSNKLPYYKLAHLGMSFLCTPGYPKTPLPMKYCASEEKTYQTPLRFQAFMYEIDLLQCFLNIYEYIVNTYEQMCKLNRPRILIADLIKNLAQIKSNQDGLAFFQLHKNRLDSYFPKSYLPEEFTLKTYPTTMNILQKSRSHHLIKDKKIYRYGLNKKQFDLLELLFMNDFTSKYNITYSDYLEKNYDQIQMFLARKG